MREGRLRTGLRIAVSTAIGLLLALTASCLAQSQPTIDFCSLGSFCPPGPARDAAGANVTVSEPPPTPATAHAVGCGETFGKDSSHLKLSMGFGLTNVTATDIEDKDGTKVAASVIFPDDPQQRLEVWWTNSTLHSGTYLIVITGKSEWTAPGGLRLGLTLAELEKLNHKSFKLKGFDENGVATVKDWNGGELASLAGGCSAGPSLRANPKASAKVIGALSPDKEYASTTPQMRAAKPTVSEILIWYPTDAPATEAAPSPSGRSEPLKRHLAPHAGASH